VTDTADVEGGRYSRWRPQNRK